MDVMHIHFYGHLLYEDRGSVEKIIATVLPEFSLYKVTAAFPHNRNKTYTLDETTVFSFAIQEIKKRILNKILGLNSFVYTNLVKLIDEHKPSVLHFHNKHGIVDEVVNRLKYRPKIIVQYHRHFDQVIVPESTDVILTVSNSVADHVKRTAKTSLPVLVVNNPVPRHLIKISKNLGRASEKRLPTLFYCGGMQMHKSFYELINVTEKLLQSGIKFRTLISGPKMEKFKRILPNTVNLGFLPASRNYEFLISSDIFISPSYVEGFPLSVLEAMYLGKLIVSTREGGLKELVNSHNAIVVKARDETSLYESILEAIGILRSDDKSRQIRAARKSEEFLPERIARKLEEVYSMVLD